MKKCFYSPLLFLTISVPSFAAQKNTINNQVNKIITQMHQIDDLAQILLKDEIGEQSDIFYNFANDLKSFITTLNPYSNSLNPLKYPIIKRVYANISKSNSPFYKKITKMIERGNLSELHYIKQKLAIFLVSPSIMIDPFLLRIFADILDDLGYNSESFLNSNQGYFQK